MGFVIEYDAADAQGSQVLASVKGRFAFPLLTLDSCCAPDWKVLAAASDNFLSDYYPEVPMTAHLT